MEISTLRYSYRAGGWRYLEVFVFAVRKSVAGRVWRKKRRIGMSSSRTKLLIARAL